MSEPSIPVLLAARAAHEMNRVWCLYLGDTSQTSWGDAPQWQRDSAIAGVEAILATPELSPQDMHEQWAERKRAEGWTHGETKDATKKTHPCLVPFSQLPKEQQIKDMLFGLTVRHFLGFVGHLSNPIPAALVDHARTQFWHGYTDVAAYKGFPGNHAV